MCVFRWPIGNIVGAIDLYIHDDIDMNVVARFIRAGIEVEVVNHFRVNDKFEALPGHMVLLCKFVLVLLTLDPQVKLLLMLGNLLFMGLCFELLSSQLLPLFFFVQDASLFH